MRSFQKSVLLVEDEHALRNLLAEEFDGTDIRVFEAQNGQEGLEVALREHPDLIVMDLLMPQMGGIEMLKKLRMDEWGRSARIVILTQVENDIEKTVEALDLGVFEYIVKSRWTLARVAEKIREKLEEPVKS